jgi:opacity protein-like surface antigen
MKMLLAGALALALTASPAAAQSYSAGFNVGPTWAMSGESPINFRGRDRISPRRPDFTQDFDTGYSIGGWVTGPLSGMFGWRGEFGYDRMPADGDPVAGVIGGDYSIARFMGGIQVSPFETAGSGMPYVFFVIGGAHQGFKISDTGQDIDFNSNTKFGLSFGGGYNWNLGDSWGVGTDLHVNAGFFEDDTRWWWTPSAQVFFGF